ncbi:MAG: Gfo/Idh/MocA family oxidoreductase [bacterium]|nr:Gfo/Idh/MocA family oxidoreductase [bacterium]
MEPRTIRWGILAPGRISRKFAAALRESAGAQLVAVGSREVERAAAFAAEFAAEPDAVRAHGSYEALAADHDVDAVYIGSPHSGHEAHTLLCLAHGKHVLCEKPLAVNAAQGERMVAAARAAGLLLMEAVWTRFLPSIARVRELVAAGTIGEVRLVNADFGFRAPFDPQSRLFAPELAGGALLDLGIYPLTLASMFCGPPTMIHAVANLCPTGVDEETAIVLRHARGELATLSCSLRCDTPREAHVIGTEGRIRILFPWWAGTRIAVQVRGGEEQVFDLPSRGGGYAHEAEAFMDLLRAGRTEPDVMPLDDSLSILCTMDVIRKQCGVRYSADRW